VASEHIFGTWGSFSNVVSSKVAGGMYLQLSRRDTEKTFWALRACAITCTVQSPDEEEREEAEHDTPSGTCSLHTPVPPALHPPQVFTEKAVGWRHIKPAFPFRRRADPPTAMPKEQVEDA
jgi:hypothetical protein